MLEIFGQDLVLKPILIFHNKGIALISPMDDVGVNWVL